MGLGWAVPILTEPVFAVSISFLLILGALFLIHRSLQNRMSILIIDLADHLQKMKEDMLEEVQNAELAEGNPWMPFIMQAVSSRIQPNVTEIETLR